MIVKRSIIIDHWTTEIITVIARYESLITKWLHFWLLFDCINSYIGYIENIVTLLCRNWSLLITIFCTNDQNFVTLHYDTRSFSYQIIKIVNLNKLS